MGNAVETIGIRHATHANGNWYHADEDALTEQIQALLNESQTTNYRDGTYAYATPFDEDNVQIERERPIRALVVPHGPLQIKSAKTAAAAYRHCNPVTLQQTKSILLLYPSHNPAVDKFYNGKCAVTGADWLETPMATLKVDTQLRHELVNTAPESFAVLPRAHDEEEHGAELQFPWIAHILRTCNLLDSVTVTPMMVGTMSTGAEIALANRLRPIFQRREILVIVSTNLCYWGTTVGYQAGDRSMTVPQFLATQDHRLLKLIQTRDVAGLAAFWLQTDHTTCGRHALAIWLRCMGGLDNIKIQVCEYQQSLSLIHI